MKLSDSHGRSKAISHTFEVPQSKRPRRRFTPLIAIGLVLLGIWQQQAISDQIKLFRYSPPAAVVQLADNDTMTTLARRLFYVNHPSVLDRSTFNTVCGSTGEQSIVLGCYHPTDNGIYVFDVNDTRLEGVEQVTAAHEMLHAAYDRLSASKRAEIDQQLESYYNYKLTDTRIKATIDGYKKSEPNDVVNEMHSIFGTESRELPEGLSKYYAQYFTDRSKVVDYATNYQSEFTSRQQQVDEYDKRLQSMSKQIDENKGLIDSRGNDLDVLRIQMDGYRSQGNIAAYNRDVPSYNSAVQGYNQLVTDTRSLIAQYNELVKNRNEIAVQVTDLAHSIDSNFGQTK